MFSYTKYNFTTAHVYLLLRKMKCNEKKLLIVDTRYYQVRVGKANIEETKK